MRLRLALPRLGADPDAPFPEPATALHEPEGLLAVGGDLQPLRLLNAYRRGIFPWFSEGQPPLWWSPDPRMVFDTNAFRLSRRFRRELRSSHWRVGADQDFDLVIAACAEAPRPGQDGTWITGDMRAAYGELHRLGWAHSVEVRDGRRLVGGIYGVAIGRMFFGESMFSAESGGSKVALAGLCRLLAAWDFPLLDAQVENPHLVSLGGKPMPRPHFLAQVAHLCGKPGEPGTWREKAGDFAAASLAAQAPD